MTDRMMESYLDSIAEQVVDEDKIVTYKSLSRSLGIHVNTAKQLLYTYLTNEKAKNTLPISATYLVAGKVIDGSFNVTVVNESDLKDAYAQFIEVTSEHVYSVQKGKNLKEVKVLCGVNKETSKAENFKPVITCSKAVKSQGGVKKKVENYEESNKKAVIQALLPEKQKITPSDTNVKKIETPVNRETTTKSPKKTSAKGIVQTPQGNVQKPAGSIANMFAKAAQKNAVKQASVSGKMDKNPAREEKKEVEVVPEVEKTENEELEKSESRESLKRKKKGNKRKRIQMLSDSEESDSNDDEEEKMEVEVEEEETPPVNINMDEEEEEREEVKEFVPRNKRKKRKVIDRTVMNEDGYLETKKEVVFETDSEPEETTTALNGKQKGKTEGVNKGLQGAGTGKKQASLLTFFKKS